VKAGSSRRESVGASREFAKWNATPGITQQGARRGFDFFPNSSRQRESGSGMKNGKMKGKDFFDVKEIADHF